MIPTTSPDPIPNPLKRRGSAHPNSRRKHIAPKYLHNIDTSSGPFRSVRSVGELPPAAAIFSGAVPHPCPPIICYDTLVWHLQPCLPVNHQRDSPTSAKPPDPTDLSHRAFPGPMLFALGSRSAPPASDSHYWQAVNPMSTRSVDTDWILLRDRYRWGHQQTCPDSRSGRRGGIASNLA